MDMNNSARINLMTKKKIPHSSAKEITTAKEKAGSCTFSREKVRIRVQSGVQMGTFPDSKL